MEKKIYISPLTEVMPLGSDIIMQVLGPASVPSDSFKNNAPSIKAPALGNDSVAVF